jgi:osmotically-inducible protein OsmY
LRNEDNQRDPNAMLNDVLTAIEKEGIQKASVNIEQGFVVLNGIASTKEQSTRAEAEAKSHLISGYDVLNKLQVVKFQVNGNH